MNELEKIKKEKQECVNKIKKIGRTIKLVDAYIDYAEKLDDKGLQYMQIDKFCEKNQLPYDCSIILQEISLMQGNDYLDKVLEYQDKLDELYNNLFDEYDLLEEKEENELDKIIENRKEKFENSFEGTEEEFENFLGWGKKNKENRQKKREERKEKREARKEARKEKREARKEKRHSKRERKKELKETYGRGKDYRRSKRKMKDELKQRKKKRIKEQREIIRKNRTGIRKFAKKTFKVFKSAALAIPRNAFLGILKLNGGNLAKRLKEGMNENKDFNDSIKRLWLGLGGNMKSLKNAYDNGSGKKPLRIKIKKKSKRGADGNIYNDYEIDLGIGYYNVAGEDIAALVISAIPIIIPVISNLTKIGKSVDIEEEDLKNAEEIANEENEKYKQDLINEIMNDNSLSAEEKEKLIEAVKTGKDITSLATEFTDVEKQENNNKILWYGIGGALLLSGIGIAIYSISKNKK